MIYLCTLFLPPTLLSRVGIKTRMAHNAEQALLKAQQGTFDLITLDIDLSGVDGFTIYQRFQHRKRTAW